MKHWPAFLLAPLFLLLAYFALRLAYADFLFRTGRPDNIAQAAALVPSNPEYQARLGNLRRALQLNPYFSAVWLEVAADAEAKGDLVEAERCLVEANKVDATFEPRWALANFYFRRDRREDFWKWMRLAAEHSFGDRASLFQLAWRTETGSVEIERRLTTGLPDVLGRYVEWLLKGNKLDEAGRAAVSLAEAGYQTESNLAIQIVHRLVEKRRVEPARELWNALVGKSWIRGGVLPSDGGDLTNAGLAWKPTGNAFDWVLPWRSGVEHRWRPGQLTIHLDGREEEKTGLLTQMILVRPQTTYEFQYRYRTDSLAVQSGVHWQVFADGQELEVPVEFLSSSDWKSGRIQFRAPAGERLLRIILMYERAKGTVRQEGDVVLDGNFALTNSRSN